MAHILMICHRIPYPPDKGDKIRAWNILSHLSQNHRVSLVAFVDEARDRKGQEKLESMCDNLFLIDVQPWWQRLRGLVGLFLGQTATVSAYPKSRAQTAIESVLSKGDVDLIYAFSGVSAALLPESGWEKPVFLDFVDVDSEKWRAYGKKGGLLAPLYALEGRRLAALEHRLADQARACLFVSEAEKGIFQKSYGGMTPVIAVENGVQLSEQAMTEQQDGKGSSPNIIFTGVMTYPPNVEAVCWFVEHVWPAIIERFSAARFTIAGSPVAGAVQQLTQKPGIVVTGYVADMADEMAKATIAIAPLFVARGIQNKVLEAMAAGLPVVATSQAAHGLDVEAGQHILIADDAKAYKETIIDLLSDQARASFIGHSARSCVQQRYQWPERLGPLEQLIEDCIS